MTASFCTLQSVAFKNWTATFCSAQIVCRPGGDAAGTGSGSVDCNCRVPDLRECTSGGSRKET